MKISFVEPHLELYGGIRRILEISNRLAAMGEDVTIYHPSGEPCAWMETKAAVRPLQELHQSAHDVVIFNDPPDYPHVRRARARLKVFYILALYEREQLKRFNFKIFWPKKGRMMALKRALQLPFLRISNATWMQQYLERELGIESLLLLGGISRQFFHPVEVEKTPNRVRILASGDPRERKGMDTVLEAVEIVRARHPEVLLDTYHGLGIPQSRMAVTYCSADIFVDAQWYAGWNNPVAEAMACGVPVVCTDIGGVADFAFHEKTALLVPVRDAKAMAAAILRLLDDPELANRLKNNAHKQISKFDWDECARSLLGILGDRMP